MLGMCSVPFFGQKLPSHRYTSLDKSLQATIPSSPRETTLVAKLLLELKARQHVFVRLRSGIF